MRIFVTGASGWIGSALVPQLQAAGHHVVGLARSQASAEALDASGVEVQLGSLEDLDTLREAATKADGVVHLAFIHDFSQYEASIGVDLAAIDAFGDALRDSGKPFVIASGVAAERKGDLATEDDPPHPLFPRATAARTTLALADRGVRSSVVRLPPSVHGRGDKGFVPTLVETARLRGSSGYVGEGMNRWPAVHREDAARLFGIAVERAAPGSVLHAVGDEGIPTRSIAEVIGRHLALPAVSVPAQEVGEHFGWIGGFFSLDVAASNELTRARFGWQPTGPGLIADLDEGHYFEPPA